MIVLPRAPMRRGLEDIKVIHFRGGSVEHRQIEGEPAAGSPFFIAHVPLPGELLCVLCNMLAHVCARDSWRSCSCVAFKRRGHSAENTEWTTRRERKDQLCAQSVRCS